MQRAHHAHQAFHTQCNHRTRRTRRTRRTQTVTHAPSREQARGPYRARRTSRCGQRLVNAWFSQHAFSFDLYRTASAARSQPWQLLTWPSCQATQCRNRRCCKNAAQFLHKSHFTTANCGRSPVAWSVTPGRHQVGRVVDVIIPANKVNLPL